MQNRAKRFYQIAGLKISLESPDFEEKDYLSCFRTEAVDPDLIYNVSFADELQCPEGKPLYEEFGYEVYEENGRRIRILRHDYTKEIAMWEEDDGSLRHKAWFISRYSEAWGSNMVLKIMNLPRQIIRKDGVFLHSSFVVRDGKAILFSGNKQVGKSTQAALWSKYRGTLTANGDRAALRKIDNIWCACGSPYCGTSKICENVICPIEAIIILSQGKENTIALASPKEALVSLLDNCSFETWDREQVERMMNIAEKLIQEILFVKLSCVPDESAVEALEEFLWQMKK